MMIQVSVLFLHLSLFSPNAGLNQRGQPQKTEKRGGHIPRLVEGVVRHFYSSYL
jgi:hypothetical protein